MLTHSVQPLTINDIAILQRSEALENLARKFAFGSRSFDVTLSFNRSKSCHLLSKQARSLYSYLRTYWSTIALGLESSRENISKWNFFIAYCDNSMVIDVTYKSEGASDRLLQQYYLDLKMALAEFDSASSVTYSEICGTGAIRVAIIYSAL